MNKIYRKGYRTIYIGNRWMEIISPRDNSEIYKESLLFWAQTAKEWNQKMKVISLPTYLDVHSYNHCSNT